MSALVSSAPDCCPLCGQPNQCAMELQRLSGQSRPPCWCTQVDFSAPLLSRLPPASRGVACICAACAKAQKNPAGYVEAPE